jgi:hypothetical protein
MIVVRIRIAETAKGLSLSMAHTNALAHTKRESLALLALDALLRPLLRRVAVDFHHRFLQMPKEER